MSGQHYILNGREVVKVDLMTWAKWFDNIDTRRVGLDRIGHYTVSTVFLGLDHRFRGEGPPVTFETMVFDDRTNDEVGMQRYCTYDDAERGHAAFVAEVREAVDKGEDFGDREREVEGW